MMGWQWHQLNHMQASCILLQKITTPAPHQSDFYGPDALPDTQPTASTHWTATEKTFLFHFCLQYTSDAIPKAGNHSTMQQNVECWVDLRLQPMYWQARVHWRWCQVLETTTFYKGQTTAQWQWWKHSSNIIKWTESDHFTFSIKRISCLAGFSVGWLRSCVSSIIL